MGYAAGQLDAINAGLDAFGVSGTYTPTGGAPVAITVELHPVIATPGQSLDTRKIVKSGGEWLVNVKRDSRPLLGMSGQSSEVMLAKFLASDVTTVSPHDTLTVGTETWKVI